MRIFKAKTHQLLWETATVTITGLALVAWKGIADIWFLVTLLVGYLTYRLFLAGAAIKTVTLLDDGVDIAPLLPWFKSRRWLRDDLATYDSVAVKRRPFMGIVTPKEGKQEVIWASGTNQFIELDELLRNLLPAPQKQERVRDC